jgi:hypothetical protein
MTIAQRIEDGRWPTNDPLAGIPRNGLVVALDAGIASSYPGSGGTWYNLCDAPADGSAKSAYDVTANQLRWNGVAGRRSTAESWTPTVLQASCFVPQTTFMHSLHKAGAAFTIASVVSPIDFGYYQAVLDTGGSNSTNVGVEYCIRAQTGYTSISVTKGVSSTPAFSLMGTLPTAISRYNFIAATVQDGGSAGLYVNGEIETVACSYSSPTTGGLTGAKLMAAVTAANDPFNIGSRMALYLMWNRALSKGELDTAFGNLRNRWGI